MTLHCDVLYVEKGLIRIIESRLEVIMFTSHVVVRRLKSFWRNLLKKKGGEINQMFVL